MRLTEFGKAIGKGQEVGPTFKKSVFGRKPISLANVVRAHKLVLGNEINIEPRLTDYP
jgi:hypothetical protein